MKWKVKKIRDRSVWRDPAFVSFHPPQNWDDMQLYCGTIHQPDNPGMNCGVCGDPLSQAQPRDNEIGGKWYRGIITERYTAGSVRNLDSAKLCKDHKLHKNFWEVGY